MHACTCVCVLIQCDVWECWVLSTVEFLQGRAQSGGDEHQVQDTGDPSVHHGCQAGPADHQPPGHLQEGVQNT